ncbi:MULTISPECIES: hypothetical protein [unclassified Microbulbifer]|uniref:hypothetical protein n=1 Tax=unclassified Microbulbifer TaxID=2619833 RepID=UPI0024AC8DE2|nr:hypothetical protein [Microbulbifer sp. VAAF005]WHI44484.1 hypothetical protein P0078_12010 [Microbulbifer sp. VAAF005]
MEQGQYLCDHYRFAADQRLKVFNFFVVLTMFVEGGIFTAMEKDFHPLILALLGGSVVILVTVFWLMDIRSRQLIKLAVPALKTLEMGFPEEARIFSNDAIRRGDLARYTFAFRVLLVGQLFFGLGVASYGIYHWYIAP